MNHAAYLTAVDEEIARLQQLRALLQSGLTGFKTAAKGKRLGRPPGISAATPAKRKGGMSAEGRARVAEAQRKRWAAKKKAEAAAVKPRPATNSKAVSTPKPKKASAKTTKPAATSQVSETTEA